jgi:hypothetical protein
MNLLIPCWYSEINFWVFKTPTLRVVAIILRIPWFKGHLKKGSLKKPYIYIYLCVFWSILCIVMYHIVCMNILYIHKNWNRQYWFPLEIYLWFVCKWKVSSSKALWFTLAFCCKWKPCPSNLRPGCTRRVCFGRWGRSESAPTSAPWMRSGQETVFCWVQVQYPEPNQYLFTV